MNKFTGMMLETMAKREADLFVECFREVTEENEDFDLTDEQFQEIWQITYDCFMEEHDEVKDDLDERFNRLDSDRKFSKIFHELMESMNEKEEEPDGTISKNTEIHQNEQCN